MDSHGEASAPSGDFVHQALIYGSDREFMDVALPFVERGLNLEQPTLVSVQGRHVENLQAALGGTPEGLTLHPVEDWYETSARTRDKFASWATERAPDSPGWGAPVGARPRGTGEGLGQARVGDQRRLRKPPRHLDLPV